MEPEPSPSALQLENLVEENGFPLMEPPEDAKLVQNMLRSYAADAISISGEVESAVPPARRAATW